MFKCLKCGNCCRVPGYVHLRSGEAEAMGAHLGIPVDRFMAVYTRLTANRQGLSLNERADASCVFLTDDGTCRINDVKPQQCRDFPEGWNYPGYEQVCPSHDERR